MDTSLDEGETTTSMESSAAYGISEEDRKKGKGKPWETCAAALSYISHTETRRKFLEVRKKELRLWLEERLLDPGYVPPLMQSTRAFPKQEELLEQVRDLSNYELERRSQEALGEIEKMVSVSFNLNSTFKKGMRLATVQIKAYVVELTGKTATSSASSDPQLGLLQSANERLKMRLASCKEEIKTLWREVESLRAGQVPHPAWRDSTGWDKPPGESPLDTGVSSSRECSESWEDGAGSGLAHPLTTCGFLRAGHEWRAAYQ